MALTRKKNDGKRKKILIFSLAALLVLFILTAEIVNRVQSLKRINNGLIPFTGFYRIETVTGKMKRRIGETVTIQLGDGQLTFRVEDDAQLFSFPRLEGDDFEIKPTNIRMAFVRDSKGAIIGMVSKPDLRGFHFTLRKMEKDGKTSNEPLER